MKSLYVILAATLCTMANAADIVIYDSVVSLATNGVKQYTFIDPVSSAYAVIAVTMSPYSSGGGEPFTGLDDMTRLGIGLSGGDGNWIDADEGVDFNATMISSSGVMPSSVQFGITGLGLRPEGGTARQWTSSAGTISFVTVTEGMQTLDTNTAPLNGTNYSAQLRSTADMYQLSDVASVTGQGLVLNASFVPCALAGFIVPSSDKVCPSSAGNTASGPAGFTGYTWTLTNAVITSDGNSQTVTYLSGAFGTVVLGLAVTDASGCTANILTNVVIDPLPNAFIALAPSIVSPNSAGNSAMAPSGAATYQWTITNGVISGAANIQSIVYSAGSNGNVGLTLVVGNGSGCSASSSTNVPINLSPANPRARYWLTTYSSKYARVYTNDTMAASGTTLTTWGNASLKQSVPAYCGVQQILSSSNYVYIRTTGFGSHVMGPWYNNAARTNLFVNFPTNQKAIYRFPSTPTIPTNHTFSQLGEIGMTVDGVRIFDANDAFSYSNAHGQDATPGGAFTGDGIWNRDAWVNEGMTMDPANAHQQNTGRYHYHATPIALRYLLGDHVDFNPITKSYNESTNPVTKHSPILGWLQDGLPLYGPYGYSNPSNSASGLRRMISGFVARNGSNGTTNLGTIGRHTLPAWAARTYNRSVTLAGNQYGPNVANAYPIGQYLEDYDYLGDIGKVQGSDFDLDEYNERWCVTPEFPEGTHAYFTTITESNTPAYPYNMGRLYYGTGSGGLVSAINQTVTTNFNGGPDAPTRLTPPAVNGGSVTLVWSATEGGTYQIESTTNFNTWSTNATGIAPVTNRGSYTFASLGKQSFFRVARTALASYDSAFSGGGGSSGGGNGILSISPTSGMRGTNVNLTVNLDPSGSPPPQMAPVNSVMIGTINGTNNVHVSQTQVTSIVFIPGGADAVDQTVSVTFPGPPENPSDSRTYYLTNGFKIN